MAIATATLDFDPFSSSLKVTLHRRTRARSAQSLPAAPRRDDGGATVVARQSTLRTVSRGTILAAQGCRIDVAMLVVRGKIRSVCRAANGREISVEVFRGRRIDC